MSNYPDGLSDGTPDAPWNAPDAPEGPCTLTCDECGREMHEDYNEDGTACGVYDDEYSDEPCPGTMRAPEPMTYEDWLGI